jgi:hypothetical protein
MPAPAGELRPCKIQNRRTRDIRLPPSTSSVDFFCATHSSTFRLTRDANPISCVQFISCGVCVGYELIPKKGNCDFRRLFWRAGISAMAGRVEGRRKSVGKMPAVRNPARWWTSRRLEGNCDFRRRFGRPKFRKCGTELDV